MPTATYLTKAELARHFQLPESTIRFYCTRFADFLPTTGEGRTMRYAEACLEVLAFIKESLPQARTSAVMEDLLTQRFPRHTHKRRSPKKSRAPQAGTGWPTATIPERFSHCPLPAQETPLLEQVIALRGEVQRLRILLDTSEKTHQADLDQLRAWMSRLTRESASKRPG